MGKRRKDPTLTGRILMIVVAFMLVSNFTLALMSFGLNRSQSFASRARDAENIATAMALRIDGDRFAEIMKTMEKNDYWYEVKAYADNIAVKFETAYLYILDAHYDDEVYYFAEGAMADAPFDLGMHESVDIYDQKMFDTIKTGASTASEPYDSGDYGEMVSGFAAIRDSKGQVVGVVGADFLFDDIIQSTNRFGLTMVLIAAGFIVSLLLIFAALGNKVMGRPMIELDNAAKRLALGDTDIHLNLQSRSEIGRLSNSFNAMVDSIRQQAEALGAIASGDFTVSLSPRSEKDVMGRSIAQILENMNGMFSEISQSAGQVSESSRQISDGAQSLARGAGEQASAIEELSASVARVSASAEESMKTARQATDLADAIKKDAEIGSAQMSRMTQAVRDINDASVSINKVIKAIDDIAFQTNILALNASVEAARAGQHGKGFAVVAGEVRNLAAKSAEAAKNTGELIADSIEKAKLGSEIADETAVSLSRIIQGVNETAVLIDGIADSFSTQNHAMSQINTGVERVSNVVQQNTASAEESSAASQEMSGQAELLHGLIGQLKVKNVNSLEGRRDLSFRESGSSLPGGEGFTRY